MEPFYNSDSDSNSYNGSDNDTYNKNLIMNRNDRCSDFDDYSEDESDNESGNEPDNESDNESVNDSSIDSNTKDKSKEKELLNSNMLHDEEKYYLLLRDKTTKIYNKILNSNILTDEEKEEIKEMFENEIENYNDLGGN